MSQKGKRSVAAEDLPLPRYNAGDQVGPATVVSLEPDTAAAVKSAQTKNIVWTMCQIFFNLNLMQFLTQNGCFHGNHLSKCMEFTQKKIADS